MCRVLRLPPSAAANKTAKIKCINTAPNATPSKEKELIS